MKRYWFAAMSLLILSASAHGAPPSTPAGSWLGTLDAGAFKLRIVFHVKSSSDGVLSATMDSPDQGARGIPVDKVSYIKPTLRIEMPKMGLVYESTLDGDRLTGTFTQGGKVMPLTCARTADTLEPRKRPQNPQRPFPYREEDVQVQVPEHYGSVRANVLIPLAGTLSLPPGKGPFPAVLLISGSGPQDRDETLFEHKPFLVLSDALVRAGIATLRFDDRGTGKSGSSQVGLTTLDLAEDVRAELAYLVTRPEIDRRSVGLIGHSEGGTIAPIVAATSTTPKFLVLLAGTGVPGFDVLHTQGPAVMRAAGMPEPVIAHVQQNNDKIYQLMMHEPDPAKLEAGVRAALKDDPDALPVALATVNRKTVPWMRTFLALDPAPYLKKVKVPVLALNGERDLQVDVSNLAHIEQALTEGGNKHVTTKRLPGLNHLFQHSATGAPSDYATIEETLSPEVIALVRDFVLAQAAR
jgi:uncharacterized protein